jgi:hypothetical protein
LTGFSSQETNRFDQLGMPGAFKWMIDRHNGKPIVPGCKTESISRETLLGGGESLLLRGILANILAWMGKDVGPYPSNSPTSLANVASLLGVTLKK